MNNLSHRVYLIEEALRSIGFKFIECESCGGSGSSYHDRDCPGCDGRGKVIKRGSHPASARKTPSGGCVKLSG